MNNPTLPLCSWVPVTTRRLRRPRVLWTSAGAAAAGFDADQVFCCPGGDDRADAYTDETRVEWADRYGGIGVGTAGGSGRCSTFNGLQTKGVGATPLVAPDADRFHSSGMAMLMEAAAEVVFAGAYQAALPFGAVPVHALVLTGGRYRRDLGNDFWAPCVRTLIIRPFVPRPAHFMRNIFHVAEQNGSADMPGLTADTWRVTQSMRLLPAVLKHVLCLEADLAKEPMLIDTGLRELARRCAWQSAAGFAKRLPHGSISCSNLALDGAYLDFGLSSFASGYRRLFWLNRQDPWTESQFLAFTLVQWRQQISKYCQAVDGANVLGAEALATDHAQHLQQRLAIEMARMSGLTEDMAQACPPELLQSWFRVMREVWTRGADELHTPPAGRMVDGAAAPAPRLTGRHDLNAVLAAAGYCGDAPSMDVALSTIIGDERLRVDFVKSALQVRAFLTQWMGCHRDVVNQYLGRQSARKNLPLTLLKRDDHASLSVFRQLEADENTQAVGPAIDQALSQARHVLADLDPELPGLTGHEQIVALAATRHRRAESEPA